MAQVLGAEEAESLRIELVELGRSLRSPFQRRSSSFQNSPAMSSGSATHDADAEYALQWQQIDRLPTFRRLRASLFSIEDAGEEFDDKGKEMIDVTKLGSLERHGFIERLIKDIRNDNMRLLQKIRRRMDKVGVKYPAIEVRYRNLCVEAVCEVVQGKPLPTVWNSIKSVLYGLKKLAGSKTHEAKINIMEEVSGIIKPGRITLLLGPPGCGKTSLLKALSGNLDQSVKVIGEVSYNGYKLEEFVPQKTSAYISQHDLHLPEMTVREILDFSARCQGVGSREEIMMELIRREKDAGIIPDPDTDTYMKAIAAKGLESNLRTDHVLKIFGLDFCSETQVGDAMRRGLSGGEKRRLTAGEIIVGPTRALFMDEITNGLDSSTAFQVVACLQQFVHITDATILVSLLQPAPETFDLFDDLILMAEGKIVYHGPRDHVLGFFEDCGFRCPERKGVADFLQEVLSRKDQVQYWYRTDLPHNYVSVDMFSGRFMQSIYGKKLDEELPRPSEKSKSDKNALSFSAYSIPKWELFKACMSREFILMKRNSFLYAFKTTQLTLIALITMTVFLRTRMNIDIVHSTDYMGALFYALIILLIDGLPELSMTVRRLPFFFKQKQLCFFPAWAYTVPVCIMKVPISLVQSLAWTCLTYYVIGYSPEVERFLRQFLLLFGLSLASTSMFRFLASVFQTNAAATTAASFAIYLVILLGGFIITHPSMPGWLKWSFWISPMTYGEIAISLNEFHAPRWQKMLSPNITLGQEILGGRGLNFKGYFYWISVAALFGFAILFNAGFTLALSFLKTPGLSRVIISHEKLSQVHGSQESNSDAHEGEKSENSGKETNIKPNKGRMVLPFTPLAVVFQDVQYYVDTPLELKEQGFVDKKLQLLCDITGSLRPTVLTALMGVSGAGKTTLLDVLAGRKTSGYMEGHIIVGGYPKVQETFARVVGYCEQTDIHSPHITVEESVIFSAWLRLSSQIDSKTKAEFVNEVLETIELDGVKDALVGTPGVSGLSTEQRKRLTIAVELVANPSIIFMDEPTSGLDARAAAIVMRAVKNVVDTGRTIVCTIHQPSIDIFESFDELIFLKRGGRIIYSGPLGPHSSQVIEYFEGIPGVPKIINNYNPATWILEATSPSVEAEHGVDFADIYQESALYKSNKDLVRHLSSPPPGSQDLCFPTSFSQNGWGQFKSCLWKQHLSYWRNPSYNLMRIMYTMISSFVFGALFWNHAKEINNQQDLLIVLGSMYATVIFLGINNCSSVLPIIATERTVMRRERFSRMYSWWAYPLSQATIEIPYLLIQAIIFGIITYPMIGYEGSAHKIFWYFYTMFCSLLFFNYLGMLLVSITPNPMVAAIITSACYPLFNLFSGFLIPRPRIPKWWIWLYYLAPTSWSINGLFTSQYGDIYHEMTAFGETTTVAAFLRDYCGYHRDLFPLVAVVLIAYPLLLSVIFAFCIERLNFQRR